MDNLITTLTPLLIDLGIAAFIVLGGLLKAKQGLYQMAMKFVVIILALALAIVATNILSPIVQEKVWPKVQQRVEEKLQKEISVAKEGGQTIEQSFKGAVNDLLSSFKIFGIEKQIEDDGVDYSDPDMVSKYILLKLVQSELIASKWIKLVVFGLSAAIMLLVLTIIKNMIGNVTKLPVIGWVDKLGGFIVGATCAIVILLVIVRGCGLLGINVFRDNSEGTVLLNWLASGNINLAIEQIKGISAEDIKNLDIKDIRNSIQLEDLTTVDFNEVKEEINQILQNAGIGQITENVTQVMQGQ